MNLSFSKIDNQYEVEFEITCNSNIHLEFKSATSIEIKQKTVGSEYANINEYINNIHKVYDFDLIGAVYPKQIKIISRQLPIVGIVTPCN